MINSILAKERALINFKNIGTSENRVEILDISDHECFINKPSWYRNDRGEGIVIESYKRNLSLLIKCIKEGKLEIVLRGADLRDRLSNRIQCCIEYSTVVVNDNEILQKCVIATHDKPCKYYLNVNDNDELYIKINFRKCA